METWFSNHAMLHLTAAQVAMRGTKVSEPPHHQTQRGQNIAARHSCFRWPTHAGAPWCRGNCLHVVWERFFLHQRSQLLHFIAWLWSSLIGQLEMVLWISNMWDICDHIYSTWFIVNIKIIEHAKTWFFFIFLLSRIEIGQEKVGAE